MRTVLVYIACMAFAGVGVVAFLEGNLKVGVATACLATANAILLL